MLRDRRAPLLLAAACTALTACSTPQPAPAVPGAKREVTFIGMCDASGAVPLGARTFAVADDEGNVLRVYDSDRGGEPIASADLSPQLDLRTAPPKKKKKKHANRPPKKPREVDLEA